MLKIKYKGNIMRFKFFSVIRNEFDEPFEHCFYFMITKYGAGFVFNTPNYSTGMRLNPFSAMADYMRFCCKRDEKSTWDGM